MKILFVAPPYINLDSKSGGVFNEMKAREKALGEVGVDVEYLELGVSPDWSNIDLCHLFMANEGSYGLALKLKEKKPLVVSPIIDRVESNLLLRLSLACMKKVPSMYSNLIRSFDICNLADGVLVRSLEEKRRVENAYRINKPTKIVKIPFKFESDIVVKTKNQVLFLGDIGNSRKNVKNLIRACNDIKVKLVLAGVQSSGKYGEEVLRAIKGKSNIQYLGKVSEEDKVRLMRESKVFCLPSRMEGVGISGLEAISYGCNLVVTKNGGVKDYFDENTWFVDPTDVSSVSKAIRTALNTEFKHSSNNDLDYKKIGSEMIFFYEEVVNA